MVTLRDGFNAGLKAGNESMHAAGRQARAQEDYDAAQTAFLESIGYPKEEPIDLPLASAMQATFRSLIRVSHRRKTRPVYWIARLRTHGRRLSHMLVRSLTHRLTPRG